MIKAKGLGLLIKALIMVESGGNDNAIGDRYLAQPAYGALQIRQPVCDDYNRAHRTNIRAVNLCGKTKRPVAEKICRWYVTANAPKKFLKRARPEEVFARTWNGGPNGVHRSVTLKYWRKVERALVKGRRKSQCGKR